MLWIFATCWHLLLSHVFHYSSSERWLLLRRLPDQQRLCPTCVSYHQSWNLQQKFMSCAGNNEPNRIKLNDEKVTTISVCTVGSSPTVITWTWWPIFSCIKQVPLFPVSSLLILQFDSKSRILRSAPHCWHPVQKVREPYKNNGGAYENKCASSCCL